MMSINEKRLWYRLEEISAITDQDKPWTRRSFSPLFLEGRRWLVQQLSEAGLDSYIDSGGNLVARIEGLDSTLDPIVIGSHSDTVPAGGRYDGVLGVMAAIEVAQSLEENGMKLRHPLEVVDFLAEEPSEFGLSCIGSRAFAGRLDEKALELVRPDGLTLREGLRLVGGNPDDLASACRPAGTIAAYVELHIEQGRVLESEQVRVGAVTDIAGIHRDRIVIEGRADHAGATPMHLRCDALVGASVIVQEIHRLAMEISANGESVVATAGKLDVSPNAVNAVPGKVEMVLEVRSGNDELNRQFAKSVFHKVMPTLRQAGLSLTSERISHTAPTPCSEVIRKTIHHSAGEWGLSIRDLPSGAGHDGVFVSNCGPIGMIFIPCRDGLSHAPEESIEPYQAADGTKVLMHTVMRLDEQLP